MSPAPSIKRLQYMLAVARELHFRKAAEKLRVAQPFISRQVRECEDDVGFQILERSHHFVSLTKAGRVFVEDVDQILKRFENDLDGAIIRGQAISRKTASECIIALSSFASLQARRIVLELREGRLRHFDIRVRILPTDDLLNAIQGGTIRAGITFAPISHSALCTVPLGTERWIAVVPTHSHLSTLHEVSIDQLRRATLISNGVNRTHPTLFERFVAECGGTDFQFVAEVTSPSEALDLVRRGVGVAILPEGICEELPEGVATLNIYDLSPLQRILVHRREDAELVSALVESIVRGLQRQDPIDSRKGPSSTSVTIRQPAANATRPPYRAIAR